MQLSDTLRNGILDVLESLTGAAPRMHFYSGAKPANCATAATGTKLIDFALPSDWMQAAAAGVKALLGSWTGNGLAGAGTGTVAGYFRIYDAAGTTCHWQGTITAVGGGGDMTLVNTNVAVNQAVAVNSFNITAGNG